MKPKSMSPCPLVLAVLIPLLAFAGCCKAIISSSSILKNNTENDIEVRYYTGNDFKSINIKKKSEKGFDEFAYFNFDSILVSNGAYTRINYPQNSPNAVSGPNTVLYNDPGSLFNPASYTSHKTELKCDGSHTEISYKFE